MASGLWAFLMTAIALAPTPSPTAGAALVGPSSAGTPVCEVTDERLVEISGMVATRTGYAVVVDGDDSTTAIRIFQLDQRCRVTGVDTRWRDPSDVEDLAVGADGTLWVGDIGDNDRDRETVTLWKIPANGSDAIRYRLSYPDGPHDAEALLIDGTGIPVIITKDSPAGVYRTAAPLSGQSSGVTPLVRHGEFTTVRTGTSNGYAILGQALVTGAAISADRKRVLVRTYADAYEFELLGRDIATAITGPPRAVTPLPDEPQGEAIAYTLDGNGLRTISERPDDRPQELLAYQPHRPVSIVAATTPAVPMLPPPSDDRSWWARLSLGDWTGILIGLAILGVAMGTIGVLGMIRARRRVTEDVAEEPTDAADTPEVDDADDSVAGQATGDKPASA